MDLAQLGGPNLNSYKGAIFLQYSWYTTLLFLQFSCRFEVCREPNTPFSVVEKPSRIHLENQQARQLDARPVGWQKTHSTFFWTHHKLFDLIGDGWLQFLETEKCKH